MVRRKSVDGSRLAVVVVRVVVAVGVFGVVFCFVRCLLSAVVGWVFAIFPCLHLPHIRLFFLPFSSPLPPHSLPFLSISIPFTTLDSNTCSPMMPRACTQRQHRSLYPPPHLFMTILSPLPYSRLKLPGQRSARSFSATLQARRQL